MDYIIEQPSKKSVTSNNDDMQFIIEPPKKKPKTAEQIGRELPSPLQGGVNAVTQGLMFNLGDEAYGALGGIGAALTGNDIAENYRYNRDLVRGMSKQYKEDYPTTATLSELLTGIPSAVLLPMPKAKALSATASKAAQVLNQSKNVAKGGALYGGLSGFGGSEADTALGVLSDTASSAAISGGLGGVMTPLAMGIGAVGSNVAQRISDKSASDFAKRKVAESFLRSAEGQAQLFERGVPRGQNAAGTTLYDDAITNPMEYYARRMEKMPKGTPVGAVAKEPMSLLDTTATMTGSVSTKVAKKQELLKNKEAQRMLGYAEEAIGKGRPDFNRTVSDLEQKALADSKPYYDQLKDVSVSVDDELRTLLERAKPFFSQSNLRATVSGDKTNSLDDVLSGGQNVKLEKLDILKQTLYDMESSLKQSGERGFSRSVGNLRKDLIAKINELSPKTQSGESIYKLANEAYSSPKQMQDAVILGRDALKMDAMDLRDELATMGKSDKDAFMLGVFQGLKDKIGGKAGRSEIMGAFENPAIAEKLKTALGKDYRKFASPVAAEFRLRKFYGVGGNSKTAQRLAGMEDLGLDAATDVANMAKSAGGGSATGFLQAAQGLGRKLVVPESTRTQIGNLLLSDNPQTLRDLSKIASELQKQRAQNAIRYGATFGGLLQGLQ
mgnify:CR=1 FL=1